VGIKQGARGGGGGSGQLRMAGIKIRKGFG